jgi:hypothetical protein
VSESTEKRTGLDPIQSEGVELVELDVIRRYVEVVFIHIGQEVDFGITGSMY